MAVRVLHKVRDMVDDVNAANKRKEGYQEIHLSPAQRNRLRDVERSLESFGRAMRGFHQTQGDLEAHGIDLSEIKEEIRGVVEGFIG